jgi:hypothetical protein
MGDVGFRWTQTVQVLSLNCKEFFHTLAGSYDV